MESKFNIKFLDVIVIIFVFIFFSGNIKEVIVWFINYSKFSGGVYGFCDVMLWFYE